MLPLSANQAVTFAKVSRSIWTWRSLRRNSIHSRLSVYNNPCVRARWLACDRLLTLRRRNNRHK
jgi:hypothetical protein